MRDSLETLIASEAATHHRKRDITQLRRLIEDMTQHAQDPAGYLRTNGAFHRRAAQLCSNTFARSLYEGLLDFAEADLAHVERRGDFDGTVMHEENAGAVNEAILGFLARHA